MFPELERIPAALAHQVHDEVVAFAGDVVGNRVVGLEDHASTLRGVEFVEDGAFELGFVAAGPGDDVHVAAEADAVAEAAAEVDDVHAGFGFERVVGVDVEVDEVFEDLVDVAAAV